MTANAPNKDAHAQSKVHAPQQPTPNGQVKVKDRRHAAAADGAGQGEPQAAPQDESGADAGPQAQDPELQVLHTKLAASEARLSATLAQYKEALEEFEGAKARLKRDIGKEIDAGKRNILQGLLEVLDNLERALDAASGPQKAEGAFFEGVSMVRDQFRQKLEAMGVVRLQALGAPFDPDHFEAISTVPVQNPAQDGRVVGVVRDCYMLGGETLRHGMVAVGKHG